MPIVVRVVSQDDYTRWVGERKKLAGPAQAAAPVASGAPAAAAAAPAAPPAAKPAADDSKPLPLAELVSRGEKIYAANCVACHQASGQGMPAMKAPALAGNKLVTGEEQEPIDTLLNGRPNTAMQPFAQTLSDAEIAAVITYLRNSWGNKASDVQPAEVKARRK
jgi:cytochrome c oxidase subunit 2